MKLTIIQTGAVPDPLRPQFEDYPAMFRKMFQSRDGDFTFDDANAQAGVLPDPATLEGIVITGSPAGVYDDLPWLDPLRSFIRQAYDNGTPMLGVCFGHQIMADALGGDVGKSEKGWGLGRHTYRIVNRPAFMGEAPDALSVACSHQDQVFAPPASAEVILRSEFTPNAGLYYRNGRAMSVQPHPEFEDDYAAALVELRRGRAPDAVIEAALASMRTASDTPTLRDIIRRFFESER